MTRKKWITVLSIIYIITGLGDIFYFLYLASLPSDAILNITSIIYGIFALYIGAQLLQFHEIGRKVAIFYLSIQVVINGSFSFWSVYVIKTTNAKFVVAGLTFRDKLIYPFDNPFVTPGLLLVLTIIPLFVIVFLSQIKTRELFTSQGSSGAIKETGVNSPQQ